jgi:hypothetical protein
MADKIEQESHMNEGIGEYTLNGDISNEEVQKALRKAKVNKATGFDGIPNEILKAGNSTSLLCTLFQRIFVSNIIPGAWNKAIIKPIPKGSMLDPKLPTQYRGISLLSTVYKLYTSILNTGLVQYMETHMIYCDEQNGFRAKRSCADHIYALTSILRHRREQGLSTFTCFIDAEKAFDRVERDLLLYKLLRYNIKGRIIIVLKRYTQNVIVLSMSTVFSLTGSSAVKV